MVFSSPRRQFRVVLLLFFVGPMAAQLPSARAILDLSEAEQTKFVNETMDAGFPADRADQMTMLIINRSSLVLPLLERQVEAELCSQLRSRDFIATAIEMIAYAGNEQALREVSKLIAIDNSRFGGLADRTLNNSLDFRNPFTVAYHGYDLGDRAVAKHVADWTDGRLSADRMQRLFAEAMITRYGRVPDEAEWNNDPIASHIRASEPQRLKQKILEFAREASSRRELRQ